MTVQRFLQITCLALFLLLLAGAALRYSGWLPHDLFLRLDPAAALLTGLAARIWLGGFLAALAVLALTFLVGRFFCGYLCPLGTLIDGVDACLQTPAIPNEDTPSGWRRAKYALLVFAAAAALAGFSLAFLVAPIPLVTRFFALLVLPILQMAADLLLWLAVPLADALDLTGMLYLALPLPRFDLPWLTVAVMLIVLAGGLWQPRFWCRYLCPAGAMMALCARQPLIRRQVTADCIDCGRCNRGCPTGAIGKDPRETRHSECITCLTCRRVCPTEAVVFSAHVRSEGRPNRHPTFAGYRRGLVLAGLCGLGTAAVTLSGTRHLLGATGTRRVIPPDLIRPPGSLPEDAFLRRCYRCGACLGACPTNTLQPFGLAAGLPGLLTPVVTPQIGACDPTCTACGRACPTGAIRPLSPGDRQWAKVGTAHILRHKCLAWEIDRKCLVCDEVCPYDAIILKPEPGLKVPVPFVIEKRCSGCGYCEHHCPVEALPAIVVEPMEALRLAEGSYRREARAVGLELQLRRRPKSPGEDGTLYPLDEGDGRRGLPPGFSE
jgi:ferredoxin-type protein NapF